MRDGKEWKEEFVWQMILLFWVAFLCFATWATYPKNEDDDEELEDPAADSAIIPGGGVGVRKSSSELLDDSDVVKTIEDDEGSLLKCFSMEENNRLLFSGSKDVHHH